MIASTQSYTHSAAPYPPDPVHHQAQLMLPHMHLNVVVHPSILTTIVLYPALAVSYLYYNNSAAVHFHPSPLAAGWVI